MTRHDALTQATEILLSALKLTKRIDDGYTPLEHGLNDEKIAYITAKTNLASQFINLAHALRDTDEKL